MSKLLGKVSQLPWQLMALAMLLPIWCFALFARGLWMPDEPREYDIARNMLLQSDQVVPNLAGEPFLEKPPLSYWLGSVSMRLFGDTPAAARAPELAFAILTMLVVGTLAMQWVEAPRRKRIALTAALVTSTMILISQVEAWLATDAAVLACTASALLAIWKIAHSSVKRHRLGWYLVFWVTVTASFLSKSALGVMVPALTWVTWFTWERRWSTVLRHWQLYLGATISVAIVLMWFVALAHRLDSAQVGAALLDNTFGRFFGNAQQGAYELGHRATRLKYLAAIPYYVLPWTFALIAACSWAIGCLRTSHSAHRSEIRFCLSASLPALLVLGLSATARDVYFGPALLGLALLISIWLCDREPTSDRLGVLSLRLTSMLMFALATVLIIATWLLWDASLVSASPGKAVLEAAAVIMVVSAGLLLRRNAELTSIANGLSCFLLGLLLFEFFAFPAIDRMEDIGAVLKNAPAPLRGQLTLFCGDETTRAALDYAVDLRPHSICLGESARLLLQTNADQKFLVQTRNATMPEHVRTRLAQLHIKFPSKGMKTDLSLALQNLGLHVEGAWCVPGGRRYELYGTGAEALSMQIACST
jgi:4-amino-4-deoxy-L-arabinose transferase-like glycosyltransferase